MQVTTPVGAAAGTPRGQGRSREARKENPQVAWTGQNIHVSPDGSEAFIIGKYQCWGGRSGTHLWVSVKQVRVP